MYFAILWFSTNNVDPGFALALMAGLIFSLVNSTIKPFVKIVSLPLILLSMGIFVILINGAMIGLTFLLFPQVQIGFWGAIWAGLLMSLVNYLANLLVMPYNTPHGHR